MALFLRLVLAFLVVVFVLRVAGWDANKQRNGWKSPYLYLHGALATVISFLALGEWRHWYIACILGLLFVVTEALTLSSSKKNLINYLAYAVIHFVPYLVISLILNNVSIGDLSNQIMQAHPQLGRFLIASVVVIWPAGQIVGHATARWRSSLDPEEMEGLSQAGRWIGIFERLLVLIFIFTNQFQAIGFLVAAKSILRFRDSTGMEQRKQSEYVLIGTLISFTLAIMTGLILK